MRESARAALSWLRANAGRYGLDPAFHRDTDIHLHLQAGEVLKEGASAGVTMAAAMVSALTGWKWQPEKDLCGHVKWDPHSWVVVVIATWPDGAERREATSR